MKLSKNTSTNKLANVKERKRQYRLASTNDKHTEEFHFKFPLSNDTAIEIPYIQLWIDLLAKIMLISLSTFNSCLPRFEHFQNESWHQWTTKKIHWNSFSSHFIRIVYSCRKYISKIFLQGFRQKYRMLEISCVHCAVLVGIDQWDCSTYIWRWCYLLSTYCSV